jgi:hypothetical protein
MLTGSLSREGSSIMVRTWSAGPDDITNPKESRRLWPTQPELVDKKALR